MLGNKTINDHIDPNDFVITRKRKKYKFAKFANSKLCFEIDHWQKRAVTDIEVGAGTGLFSVELAERHPARSFAVIDVKADRLQKGAYVAESLGLENIWFIRARADQLGDLFDSNTVDSIWLTFPDPYPRKRSSGRRLTNSTYLSTYTKLLSSDGSLYLKHDDLPFFNWSLEQLVSSGWTIAELTFDLHDSTFSDDYKILTTYEKKWLNEGGVINFVRANKKRRIT